MASENVSRSRAADANDVAMMSATEEASEASRPNCAMVWPTTSAVGPSSCPKAWARAKVDSVALVISLDERPSLANSSWRVETCEAENTVDDPRSRAFFWSAANSLPVAPETAFTFFMANSKSAATLNEEAPIPTRGAVTPTERPRPTLDKALAVLRTLRCAAVNPRSNCRESRPRTTERRD